MGTMAMPQIQPQPFSNEGNVRYPFYALWMGAPGEKQGGRVLREDRLMVLKEFKRKTMKVPFVDHPIDLESREAYELQARLGPG